MQPAPPTDNRHGRVADPSIGRIVSVTGSKAIVLLDSTGDLRMRSVKDRPEMGILLAIDTANTIVLAIVSALSVPVPAQREGEAEIWIAELGLVGELWRNPEANRPKFNRGVTIYPALGDRVRVAVKAELETAYCGSSGASVRVGTVHQDKTIPAMLRVDELLGKHFAILGTTGTGKSCTTALILRLILEKNPNAHIVLLDPHNEYATTFGAQAEVISPRNMQLPFWLLNFEEIVEVLIGDRERKAEIEILQELIPIAKARYSSGRASESAKLRRGGSEASRYTVDTPVPYRISDLTSLIDERMGRLENKRDLAPYRQLRGYIESISQDGRYSFMFGSLTVYDGMTQVLGRIFRVPVNDKPITILELTGFPTEVVNVIVSVLCRMTFDFALWSEGKVPVTIVCEEAHRYVPVNAAFGFEPCKRAIAKIAKEGRKYGASLCIVTQRPAEIDPTILSQCNTVFALRMANDRDQAIVSAAVADTGTGLIEFLPSLGQREAIAFGDGMSLPGRIVFDELPEHCLPRSATAQFSEKWQKSVGDEGFLEQVVDRWRASGIGTGGDLSQQITMMTDAMMPNSPSNERETFDHHPPRGPAAPSNQAWNGASQLPPPTPRPQSGNQGRRESFAPAPPPLQSSTRPGGLPERRQSQVGNPAPMQTGAQSANAAGIRSLRERLTRPSGS